jgi:CspA family cold shock protein
MASQHRERDMASGKIKWFDNKKGFGFIAQSSGPDVFVHHKSIAGPGFKTLNEGEVVSFEIVTGEKGLKAENVQRVQAP